MKKLYALSMSGTMYYLTGTLSLQECTELDRFAKKFEICPLESENESCKRFLNEIRKLLNIKLEQIPISKVFRTKTN